MGHASILLMSAILVYALIVLDLDPQSRALIDYRWQKLRVSGVLLICLTWQDLLRRVTEEKALSLCTLFLLQTVLLHVFGN